MSGHQPASWLMSPHRTLEAPCGSASWEKTVEWGGQGDSAGWTVVLARRGHRDSQGEPRSRRHGKGAGSSSAATAGPVTSASRGFCAGGAAAKLVGYGGPSGDGEDGPLDALGRGEFAGLREAMDVAHVWDLCPHSSLLLGLGFPVTCGCSATAALE